MGLCVILLNKYNIGERCELRLLQFVDKVLIFLILFTIIF